MVARKWLPALAACVLVGAGSLYGVGTLSASVPRWCAVYGGAAVILTWGSLTLWRHFPRLDEVDRGAVGLYAYACLSLLWSGDWRQGLYQCVNAGSLLVVFVWVRHSCHVKHLPTAAYVLLWIALFGQLADPDGWGGHGNRNFQAEAMLAFSALALCVVSEGARAAVLMTLPLPLGYLLIQNPSRMTHYVLSVLAIGLLVRWLLNGGFSKATAAVISRCSSRSARA